MSPSRRTFLRSGATMAAVTMAGTTRARPLLAQLGSTPEPVPSIQDPRLESLAKRAIDAAKSAGATYADIRLVHTKIREVIQDASDSEWLGVGIRAMINGYWGFAASPLWNQNEITRVAQAAVQQARINAKSGGVRTIELAPIASVAKGHWTMPIEIDPYTIPPDEIVDFLGGLRLYADIQIERLGMVPDVRVGAKFVSRHKAFASTDGAYCTQQLFRSSGNFTMLLRDNQRSLTGGTQLDCLTPATVGWELFTKQPLRDKIREALAEEVVLMRLPWIPVDVGRYDVVFDAETLATMVNQTIGQATELDRAMGYEANAGGTSYLNDPLGMLGSFKVAAPSITIQANRRDPGSAATVQWDDEGVAPEPFTLIKDGVLTDFSTTREGAGWIQEYYRKSGTSLRSRGCATGDDNGGMEGLCASSTQTPNLVLQPGSATSDFESLVAGLTKGIAFHTWSGGVIDLDFQQLNGLGIGKMFEVRNGKRTARIASAGFLFRTPELWKSIQVLGGPQSVRRFGFEVTKGEPPQKTYHSVTAVPAIAKGMTIIDYLRKA